MYDPVRRGEIEEVEITGADGSLKRAFARPGLVGDPATDTDAPARLRVLSPFDPALRDRKRAHFLFGFDYRIEVFVPEAAGRGRHGCLRGRLAQTVIAASVLTDPLPPPVGGANAPGSPSCPNAGQARGWTG